MLSLSNYSMGIWLLSWHICNLRIPTLQQLSDNAILLLNKNTHITKISCIRTEVVLMSNINIGIYCYGLILCAACSRYVRTGSYVRGWIKKDCRSVICVESKSGWHQVISAVYMEAGGLSLKFGIFHPSGPEIWRSDWSAVKSLVFWARLLCVC